MVEEKSQISSINFFKLPSHDAISIDLLTQLQCKQENPSDEVEIRICVKLSDVWIPSKHIFEDTKLADWFNGREVEPPTCSVEDAVNAAVLYQVGMKKRTYGLFREAAALGHAGAQEEMFELCFRHEEKRAMKYLESAAVQGRSSALLQLSSIYNGSNGYSLTVKRDQDLAKLMCIAAARLGNPDACFRLLVADLIEGVFGTPRNFIEGFENAMRLENDGNTFASNFLVSVRRTSREAWLEIDPLCTSEDLKFLDEHVWKESQQEGDDDSEEEGDQVHDE